MVNPVIGSGNKMQKRGKLAAYKQDLLAHKDGTGFRQNASTINMHPQLTYFPGADVQTTLEAIETFLTNDNCWISIGDGVNSFGEFNVGDAGYPDIETCFAGAIATARISYRGGIIQLKAGRYDFSNTVTLPAGVSVVGEIGGTLLNATTANPIFKISESESETVRIAPAVTTDGSKQNKLYNLTFFDAFGDANPYLNLSTIITCERGSNLRVEQCSAFGKIGSAGATPPTTRFFISYDTGTTSSLNSILSIESCQVSAFQQVVDFDTEVARDNKLYVRNNRFWVSGRLGVALINRYISAVTFRACDAVLSHNQIQFGLGLSTLQTIRSAFSCYDAGSETRNLVVVGNQGHYTDSTLVDDNNRLLTEDNGGLEYIRAAVSGNTMGGSSDSNTWYIVVGDGANSVGDINGEYAIQNILKYFYDMNISSEHGGIVIYVKPGDYTIDDETIFETPAIATRTGLPLSLIGVSDNGNFPTITFNVAGTTVGGQEMMFGHHIENIYFDGGSDYYKIMIRNDFANPDARTTFFRNVLIKNCAFKNCSIGMLASTSSASTEYMKNEVFIEDCQFSNTAVISNFANPETMIAIRPSKKNGKIYVKRCYTTEANWRGELFRLDTTNADTLDLVEVEISDCIYTTLECDTPISYAVNITDVKKAVLTRNKFDSSSATVQPAFMVYAEAETDDVPETELVFTDNELIGATTTPGVGLINFYFSSQTIESNLFKNLSYAVSGWLDYSGTTQEFRPMNIQINKNKCIIGASSYGFLLLRRGASAVTKSINGNISVCSNSIDMQDKTAALSYSATSSSNVYSIILVAMNSSSDEVNVDISGNNIFNFVALEGFGGAVAEAAIAAINCKNSKICKNNIIFSNRSSSRSFYAIYVSPGSPTAAYSSNTQTTDISENTIKAYNSIIGILYEVASIYVKNTDFLTITKNVLRKSSGNITWFIKAIENSGVAGNEGVITDNVLGEDLGNGGIRYRHDNSHQNTKLYVARNKNQNIIQQVNCTEFKRYGYNRNTIQPNTDATLLLKSNTLAIADSSASNANRSQLHILDDGVNGEGTQAAISSWTNLPEGLYYTNAYKDSVNLDSRSPCLHTGAFGTYNISQTNHQVIIPLNIPDFVKVNRIDIPIYWKNQTVTSRFCSASASLICGNDTEHPSEIEYIADTGVWVTNTAVTSGGGEGLLSLYNTESFYLNPVRNTAGYTSGDDDYLTSINCYIVLALYIVGVSSVVDGIYFAIPYAKVSYLY